MILVERFNKIIVKYMFKRVILLLTVLIGINGLVQAQEDPVLFTVDGKSIHLSEFKYIYSKTNGDRADFSRASLDEYLELYKNFKLKVRRAHDMQLDTIPTLQKELAGYRQQLANSYLVDKEVTERLIREAYDRTMDDVDISHIMITLKPNATEKEIKIADQKLITLKRKLDGGADFATIAKEHSEDTNTKKTGGRMGYFTALFPDGFYNLETAAYTTAVGQVSGVVETAAGLHLVKVHDKRKARGQVEVAHILVRNAKDGTDTAAKARIDSLYQALKKGSDFDLLAKNFSDDNKTKDKNGYFGFIGIRQVGQEFEDAAFALNADGDYSQPVKSTVGWHIIKRISKKPIEAYDIAKRRIQTKLQENQRRTRRPKYNRLNNARQSMLARIKKDGNFTESAGQLNSFIESLDSSFVSYKWKAPKDASKKMLLSLGTDFKVTLGDFQNYCQRNSKRMRMGNRMERAELVRSMYGDFVEEKCIAYEETQLETKYPEFKSLMREYEEGILLFEATKILVWDKASQDTVGLNEFHSKRKGVYQWNERAETTLFTVKGDEDMVKKVLKSAKKMSAEELAAKYNKTDVIVSTETKTFEKEKSKMPAGLDWKEGAISDTESNKRNQTVSFYRIENILSPTEKTLQEARGYVIADYQDYLEKQWLIELRKDYQVKVNDSTFTSMIKK